MTQERLMQIVRNGENPDYEFGKESAADLIQKKEVSSIRDEPCLASLFGSDWVRGFFDYLNAWETINGKAQ